MPIELQTNINLETTPTAPKHLVNMQWVEDFFMGRMKAPVRVVATDDQAGTYSAATMEFTYTATGETDVDGVELELNDRVLLQAQSDGKENGIYVVTTAGTTTPPAATVLQRAPDFDDDSKIQAGVTIAVTEGDEHAGTTWKLITDGTTLLDNVALEFIKVPAPSGAAKYAETITGDGVATEFDIDHNLGDEDVSVTIWNEATHGLVMCDVRIVDNNTVEIGFADPPAATQGPYRVVVIA